QPLDPLDKRFQAVARDPPNVRHGAVASMLVLRGGEGGLLLRARLLLMLLAPLVVGHAVNDLARLRVGKLDTALPGGLAVPSRQAIAAEPGQIHQVDILHIGALAQMRDEGAERRGFEFGAGLVVHAYLQNPEPYVASVVPMLNGG